MHCPYCGIKVLDDEIYCLKCGKKIPHDLEERMTTTKWKFNRSWLIPTATFCLFIIISIGLYLFLQSKTTEAEQLYKQGEEQLIEEQYEQAKYYFEDALQIKTNFTQAEIALQYVKTALSIQDDIKTAESELANSQFQTALLLINEAEHELRNYHGQAVTNLIDDLALNRHQIKLDSVQYELEKNPTIDDLKVLLWEAEAVSTEEAQTIVENIRTQIVDYTSSKAIEQLNKHQFTDAQILVEDGLKYAINSEKLLSLQKTIAKEKEAFESAQEKRIEQAINIAEEEREVNEMEAVQLEHATVTRDDQGMLIVEGEVKSVATVPINSVLVEYSLLNQLEKEFITNVVVVFPDKLYPNETGKFEFTHYEVDKRLKNINIQINKITWYTE